VPSLAGVRANAQRGRSPATLRLRYGMLVGFSADGAHITEIEPEAAQKIVVTSFSLAVEFGSEPPAAVVSLNT
jgi:hypothetical protein